MKKYSVQLFLYIALLIVSVSLGYTYVKEANLSYYYAGAFALFGVYGYFVISMIVKEKNQLEQWYQMKINYNTQAIIDMKNIGEIAINEFPFGLLMYRDANEVAWLNTFAKEYFPEADTHFLHELHEKLPEKIADGVEGFVLPIYNTKTESVHTIEFQHDPEYNAIYFIDRTVETELEHKYQQNRLVVGNLILDNLDEMLANEDVHDRVQVQATYFSIVGKWADRFGLYLKSLTDEKFLFICDFAHLQKLIDDEFSVLDEIREVNPDSPFKITASIGIGCDDKEPVNIGDLVNESVEMAFSRGGDQVVIQVADEPVQYIGGKSATIAKRSRTKSRMIAAQLYQLIQQAKNVVVISHKRPDQDAFGASLGVMKIVEHSGKDVHLYFDLLNADASVQKMYEDILEESPDIKDRFVKIQYDEGGLPNQPMSETLQGIVSKDSLVIIVDVNNPKIMEGHIESLPCKDNIVVIDHHRRGGKLYSTKLMYIEPYASSTVELVVELMQYFEEISLSTIEASSLLTGIFVDTTSFSARTGTRTFDAAAYLRSQGADMTVVKKNLREDFSELTKRAKLLSTASIYKNRFAVLSTEDEVQPVLLAKLANDLLMTNEVDAAFTVGKINSEVTMISARSFGDINVQLVMEALGGGGHLNAAACTLQQSVDEVLDVLKNQLDGLKED